MTLEIKMQMPRRRASVVVSRAMASFNNIPEGDYECHVLGLFQVGGVDCGEDVQPYFICELRSGQNIYADPCYVKFLDTDDYGNIVDEEDDKDV